MKFPTNFVLFFALKSNVCKALQNIHGDDSYQVATTDDIRHTKLRAKTLTRQLSINETESSLHGLLKKFQSYLMPSTKCAPSNSPLENPTGGPGITDSVCTTKILKITHLCNLPPLDGFPFDDYVDVKILIDGTDYWPTNTKTDCECPSCYYLDSCVIAEEALLDCYPIKNSVAKTYTSPPSANSLRISVHELDYDFDDYVHLSLPNNEWYDTSHCGVKTVRATSLTSEASFIVEVRDATSPTLAPVVSPTPQPTKFCEDIDEDTLLDGLTETADELREFRETLSNFHVITRNDNGKQLLWPALGRVASRFVSKFVKKSAKDFFLSKAVDKLSDFFSNPFSSDDGQPNESNPEYAALTLFLNDRFTAIDTQLKEIDSEMEKGFAQIETAIADGFARDKLHDWLMTDLGSLEDFYEAYLDPKHNAESRRTYETAFREKCQQVNPPYSIFKELYSISCDACNLMDGKSLSYFLDTFVDVGNSMSVSKTDKITWFRGTFGRNILGGLVRLLYLHAGCLYHDDGVCKYDDPVYNDRMVEMGDALVEVALSISNAEERFK